MKLHDDGAIRHYLNMGNEFAKNAGPFFAEKAGKEDDEHSVGAFGVFTVGAIQTMIFSTYMCLKKEKSAQAARDWLTMLFQQVTSTMSEKAKLDLTIEIQIIDQKL